MSRPLFGELAVQLGYLTREQLERVLAIQAAEEATSQARRPLGLICMQEGYLTGSQLITLLEQQQAPA